MRTKPATDKQKSLLASRFDFDSDDLNMLNRADASALIGTLLDFEQPDAKAVAMATLSRCAERFHANNKSCSNPDDFGIVGAGDVKCSNLR